MHVSIKTDKIESGETNESIGEIRKIFESFPVRLSGAIW